MFQYRMNPSLHMIQSFQRKEDGFSKRKDRWSLSQDLMIKPLSMVYYLQMVSSYSDRMKNLIVNLSQHTWNRSKGSLRNLSCLWTEQHSIDKIVEDYLQKNTKNIQIEYFPVGSSELNAVEECWRQGKYNILSKNYYSGLSHIKQAISNYNRTIRFNLEIKKKLFIYKK